MKKPNKINHSPQANLRLEEDMFKRLQRVVGASKRTKTSIIEECLEKALPELERQYEKAA
jgi:predicted DNA-binding protein